MKQHHLNITWGKAYGESYCHHSSIFIPYQSLSLFSPEIIHIGVTVRTNIIEKGKITRSIDKRIAYYLPCVNVDGGLNVPLNSSQIIEALCLNSWTSLKDNIRGSQKEFPINMFYKLEDSDDVILPFDYEHAGTPYMAIESKLADMADGDKIDSIITFSI